MLWVAGGRNGSGRKVANDVIGSKPNCWNAVHGHSAGGQEWKQIAFILLLLCMLPCAHPARLSNTKFHSLWGIGKTCWLHQIAWSIAGLTNLGEPIPLIIAYLSFDVKANVFGMHIWYQWNWTTYIFFGVHPDLPMWPRPCSQMAMWRAWDFGFLRRWGCQTLLVWLKNWNICGSLWAISLPHSPLYLRNKSIHHPYHSASTWHKPSHCYYVELFCVNLTQAIALLLCRIVLRQYITVMKHWFGLIEHHLSDDQLKWEATKKSLLYFFGWGIKGPHTTV